MDSNTKATVGSSRRALRIARVVAAVGTVGMSVWFAARVKAAESARPDAKHDAPNRAAATTRPRTLHGTPDTWAWKVDVEGTLAPAQEADLGFRAGGRLARVRVALGANVRRGDLLATLDDDEALARVAAADAEVRANEARLAMAKDDHARTAMLVGAGAQPTASGITAAEQERLADAQLGAARAARDLARAALRSHALVAPFDGSITHVPDGVGRVVAPGEPELHVMDLSELRLVGTVGETDAALVHVGQPIRAALDGREVSGAITAVLGAVDPTTRRVPIEARFANRGSDRVIAGRYVSARIDTGHTLDVVRLAASTLRPGSQDEVMRVEGDHIVAQKIAFTVAPDGALLVRAGITPNEEILEAPTPEAQTGDRLTGAEAAR